MEEVLNKVGVELAYLPVVNFAMQQNRVSVVRLLSVENRSESALKDIKITFIPEQEFATAHPIVLDTIPKGETIRVESLQLNLSTNYFAQLTERIATSFVIEVHIQSELVFTKTYAIDVLAYDQWGGITILPEMLSAFITPNHPATTPIIKRAAAILEQWTGNPSLDEYQSRNPDRVHKQMAAIYTAIAEQNIIYSTVPASFEDYGQRIRLADAVMTQKLATCLDMALFYASCLEAVGIHALIVITEGHAFIGGWLIPDTFPDNVVDDVSLLSKRIADGINDITLVETTCMCLGNGADFDKAVKVANGKLNKSNFILALDVKRARFTGIRPIPQRILQGQQWVIKEEERPVIDKSQTTPESINPYDLSGIATETSVELTKQLLWERKLLDLSLRNNLLNIRITKNTLQLIPAELDRFEDALANGDEFRVFHKPTDWDNPLYDFGIYQSVSESDPIFDLVKSELSQKRLRSYLSENDLGKALTHLYRSSRSAMEENGANTLYVALGLLRWYETPSSERPRYAPILLLPVEMIRKSASKGYVIRSREEEAMLNITLLEMLRQNFGITILGLDPLPTDESGVNVRLIYSIIRNSIRDQAKWDVEEQAILGIFSFNKFIMWNDIHNNSHKLAKNEVVSSLMSGRIEWNIDEQMTDITNLDKELSPAEIMLPIGADSSQLEAIYEAVNDKSFILHGPPGTGKSQTITNIIANSLYKGKRVLFVAEKMAALSVVQNRLAAIGLAPFCLELHSNKTKKSAILSQLRATSELVKQIPPQNFEKEANRLLALRTELNVYIEALHKEYPFGMSLYEAISRYQSIESDYVFDIPQSYYNALDENGVEQWNEAIETLVRTMNACGHPYNHPLTDITISDYSSTIKDEAIRNFTEAIDILSKIKPRLDVFANLLGDYELSYNKEDIDLLSKIVERLLNVQELTSALLTLPLLNERLDECRDICIHGKERDELKKNIVSEFSDDILTINAKQLLMDWNKASEKWFIPRFFGQRKVKKKLNLYALKNLEKDKIGNILEMIISFQKEEEYVSGSEHALSSLFGRYGRKGNQNWSDIEQIIEHVAAINSLIFSYAKEIGEAAKIKEALARQLSDGIGSFRSLHGNYLTEVNGLLATLGEKEELLKQTLSISKESLYGDSSNWIDFAVSKLNLWKNNIEKLKDWYQWLLVYNTLEGLQIGFVAEAYRTKNIPTDSMQIIFEKSVCKTAIDYIISEEQHLEFFKGKIFNEIIEKYKRLSSDFEDLTKKELFAKLAASLPDFTREATQSSEVGILQRNIRNNARGISIRKLFDQVPTLLSRMCPCMLMSPISVAQYIDADADKFDLIVFDEASQMPTYEAIGAIARGKNIVIVGDPKQMPPTSFFSTNSVDEENIEIEDLESILDDCLALSMPSKYLLWHYRSKHESLIAFSNAEYYDNKLLTFPSPDNIESMVKFVPIEGFYDKGKSRQNKAEAEAIINEIARRLRDKELRKRSIGVVTFSSVQQSLIEDLLSDLFIFHPDLETFALECEEPLFIKNLENVQGDERDIILFSVGYGPNAEGRVSMNFGPLNRVGGERRLNVAVSRARYEMIIYSTLRADQIDLNRTSAVGVAGLKHFLEYAERGERLTTNNVASTAVSTISVENIIAERLRSLGYEVHTNVGCSGYKIDIGIVDEKQPSRYKLGILCDGENYKRTKTTRDREIVQNSVLKLLSWNICRIWTMDWWGNPDEVITSILYAMNNVPKERELILDVTEENIEEEIVGEGVTIQGIVEVNNKQEYYSVRLKTAGHSTDDFLYPENKNLVLSQIRQIVEDEAPISRSSLCKKVLLAWGISRMGQRLDAYFESLFSLLPYYKVENEGGIFIWKSKEQQDSFSIYRIDSGRDAVDLPSEEIANAMKQILTDEISMPTTDLSRVCAQTFGFARSGSVVDAAMMRGMKDAIEKGYIKVDNGKAITII